MRVALFPTCLVDQVRPEVGVATVNVLRAAGCELCFDPDALCCGQPASNAGAREEARRVARRTLEVLGRSAASAIVAPSGSCAAMLRRLPALFEDQREWRERAEELVPRVHELSGFLVRVLGLEDVGASMSARLAWHDACHGLRELGLREEPRRLLAAVRGVELVEPEGEPVCCGFGGTFAVQHPELSVAMLDRALARLEGLGADAVVSGDASCLMQIGGRLAWRGSKLRALHLAEVLDSRS